MDDLPELPFEQILGYLSLEDRLKSMTVSRRWYNKINSFRVRSLCYSGRPRGFISFSRFELFVNTFGQSIFSNLKHRCDLHLNARNGIAFVQALNSFGQLEELDIIRLRSDQKI